MEAASISRSFHGALIHRAQCCLEKSVLVPISVGASKKPSFFRVSVGPRLNPLTMNHKGLSPQCVKATQVSSALTSDVKMSNGTSQGLSEKKNIPTSTFPVGFEKLVQEVCDQTDTAELKLKVGEFEMHLKREIGTPKAATPTTPAMASPSTVPPVPSKPMVESSSAALLAVPQKSPPPTTSPFTNVPSAKTSKITALESYVSNGYVLVASPTVGSFRRGRTLKGKRQPPSCKEGDVIKEGQIIGYLDQFGNELPVNSDVAGEVLKVLFKEGEAVGYGDPLIAVLPSFSEIN